MDFKECLCDHIEAKIGEFDTLVEQQRRLSESIALGRKSQQWILKRVVDKRAIEKRIERVGLEIIGLASVLRQENLKETK